MHETGSPATRHPALDWLKAFAIVAVVVTHAGGIPLPDTLGWTRSDTLFRLLLASFHVPCLLMVSGYLYFRSRPIEWSEVAQRLKRVLLPYLVASVAAFTLAPDLATDRPMLFALLTGDALPIYYYVFLLTLFVSLLPVISRASVPTVRIALVVLLGALAAMSAAPGLVIEADLFWSARRPIVSFALGYFLIGWLTAADPSFSPAALARWRYAALVILAGAWPLCIAAGSPYPAIMLAKIPYALAVWCTVWRFLDSRPAPTFVRWLSDASYGIFLYHYFAIGPLVVPTWEWLPPIRILTLTAAGIAGGLLLGVCVQTLVGRERARLWFGY